MSLDIQMSLALVVVAMQFVGYGSEIADTHVSSKFPGAVQHLAEIRVAAVFPAMSDGNGFRHVGRCAPPLFGSLMQAAGGSK